MSRRKRGKAVSGIVLLDKPAGLSSNRALQIVRRLYDARKAGHTGSLDPFATGMLPLCLGEASKTAAFMLESNKTYQATARLGVATDTGDTEGTVTREKTVPPLDEQEVLTTFGSFTGEIEQVPPMYSALKHQGQPLYKLAREGITVERKARKVRIYSLDLIRLEAQHLEFEVRCSKGTYIRTLAEDLGRALGTCAHLVALRRLVVEPFDTGYMVTLEQLEADHLRQALDQHLLPVDAGLPDWPIIKLGANQAAGFRHGNPQSAEYSEKGRVRVYDQKGYLLGLGECTEQGLLKPKIDMA